MCDLIVYVGRITVSSHCYCTEYVSCWICVEYISIQGRGSAAVPLRADESHFGCEITEVVRLPGEHVAGRQREIGDSRQHGERVQRQRSAHRGIFIICLSRLNKGSSRIVIIFKRVHRVCWKRGQWPPYALFNVHYDALHFHTGSLKITIFEVLFWEGGRGLNKEYSVYAFDNVDNDGRPLSRTSR